MTEVLCIASPANWWSSITQAPCSGPVFGEICNVVCEVPGGYVLQGYGDEPFDGRMFVRLSEVRVEEEMELIHD